MANYIATDTDLTAVADAIRTKGGTSASLAFPAEFVSAIDAIPTGGGGVDYKGLIGDTFSGALISDIAFLRAYALSYITGLTSIKLTNLTPNTSNVTQNLKDSSYCIAYNPNLEALVITSEVRVGTSTVRNNPKLKAVDVPAVMFGGSCFASDTVLDTLILRRDSLTALPNTAAFNNTPFASGGAGGTLYVPSALISSYQSATNWSTILGYSTNSIQAIEGSIYETQYADGTPIT